MDSRTAKASLAVMKIARRLRLRQGAVKTEPVREYPLLFRNSCKMVHADFPDRMIYLESLEMRADHKTRPIEVGV